MAKHVLITGGAGFIGSHLADRLLAEGHRVRALDNLSPQVHGPSGQRPAYLDHEVELQIGDVRDPAACRRALRDVDLVVHLAACVGVGQSMYEIARYTEVNNDGTAALLEAIVAHPVERILVASSMSVYGEGLYQDATGREVQGERTISQLKRGDWEVRGPDGEPLEPMATPESKPPALASIYALSKYDQERMCLMVGRAYGIPTVALRLFNVYGARQALSNPYTGVLAIFAARLLNGRAPLVYEDGRQSRDFVSVHDVAEAFSLAMRIEGAAGRVFNVASGWPRTIGEVAERIAAALGRPRLEPEITGKFRVGDIRHCQADLTLAREVLGFEPRVDFARGLQELAAWLEGQVAHDRVEGARAELIERGLAR
jgi:dTDP-L-rhamnose 4-epimerase